MSSFASKYVSFFSHHAVMQFQLRFSGALLSSKSVSCLHAVLVHSDACNWKDFALCRERLCEALEMCHA